MPATQARPKLRHAMTATAFGFVTVRNAWRAYFRGLRSEMHERQQRRLPPPRG